MFTFRRPPTNQWMGNQSKSSENRGSHIWAKSSRDLATEPGMLLNSDSNLFLGFFAPLLLLFDVHPFASGAFLSFDKEIMLSSGCCLCIFSGNVSYSCHAQRGKDQRRRRACFCSNGSKSFCLLCLLSQRRFTVCIFRTGLRNSVFCGCGPWEKEGRH